MSSQASLALRDEDQTTASERTDEGDERANQRGPSNLTPSLPSRAPMSMPESLLTYSSTFPSC